MAALSLNQLPKEKVLEGDISIPVYFKSVLNSSIASAQTPSLVRRGGANLRA
jgi:hypothetical protein